MSAPALIRICAGRQAGMPAPAPAPRPGSCGAHGRQSSGIGRLPPDQPHSMWAQCLRIQRQKPHREYRPRGRVGEAEMSVQHAAMRVEAACMEDVLPGRCNTARVLRARAHVQYRHRMLAGGNPTQRAAHRGDLLRRVCVMPPAADVGERRVVVSHQPLVEVGARGNGGLHSCRVVGHDGVPQR